MNEFKQAMEDAGLRPVDLRNLVDEHTGYRPPAATISRWMHEEGEKVPGCREWALALVRSLCDCRRASNSVRQPPQAKGVGIETDSAHGPQGMNSGGDSGDRNG